MENASLISDTYSLIARSAQKNPEGVAIEGSGRQSLSFTELLRHIHYIRECLQLLKINRCDRVAIVLPGGPEMAIVLAGVSASAVCAPLNPGFQSKEFAVCFDTMNVKLVVLAAGQKSLAWQVANKNNIPILELEKHNHDPSGMVLSFKGYPVNGSDGTGMDSSILPEDLAIVLHTSGTTSQPKIVPLTHKNVSTAVRYVCNALFLRPEDRCLCMMPQFHIGGFVDLLLAPLASGGRVICVPGIDPEIFFEQLTKCKPTWFQAVPATLRLILAHAKAMNTIRVDSSLRFIRSVAAPLPLHMMHDLETLFKVPVIETFGMTEAAPLITTNPLPPGFRKPGSTGKTVGPDVAIMDAGGNLLPDGHPGEIVVKGDNVMSGYENDSLANEQAFAHGWFHTGDIGYFDKDGYLFITGRLKEIINRGGEKISPSEIDAVLLENPTVTQAMTFAVPDAKLGEDIAVAVVLAGGHSPEKHDIQKFVADRLSSEKVPRTIIFVDDIPKGPTGKPQRINAFEKLKPFMTGHVELTSMLPRTPMERMLAEIWKDILKVDKISVRDDFFALGGDSLQIEILTATIEKKFEIPFPTSFIFKFQTVEAQAKIIEEKTHNPDSHCLTSMHHTKQNCGFWISAHFPCHDLPLIPMETLYEGSLDQEINGLSISGVAKGYVKKIRDHSVKGPYLLGGYSVGGLIAIEVARQIETLGEEVCHLFLVDPYIEKEWEKSLSLKGKLLLFCRRIKELSFRENIRSFRKLVKLGRHYLFCSFYFKIKKPLPKRLHHFYISYIYSVASVTYEPPAFTGKATIYFRESHPSLKDEAWRQYCLNAEVHILNTTKHKEILKPPYIGIWLSELKEQLSRKRDLDSV